MVSIAVRGKCNNLRVDVCTTYPSQFEFLQEEYRRSLGHHKTVALLIVGTRCTLWLFVEMSAQGSHDTKDIQPDCADCGIASSSQHPIDAFLLNRPERLPDGIRTRRTPSGNDHAGTVQLMVRGNTGSAGIRHQQTCREISTIKCSKQARPIICYLLPDAFAFFHVSHRGSYIDSCALALLFTHWVCEASVYERQISCCDSELSSTIHTLIFV